MPAGNLGPRRGSGNPKLSTGQREGSAWRAAFPEAWPELAKLGVKTVIDLRRVDEHDTVAEARAVEAAGMRYVNVPMKGVVAPSEEQIAKVLALMHSEGKVFVHCKRGADRTGAVIACYRIEHHCWAPKQALSEAKSLGMRWTQMGLKSYVNSFKINKVADSRATPGCNCGLPQAASSQGSGQPSNPF